MSAFELFSFFQACLRTATLRHNEEGQACLINLLLRNYLHYNLYDQVRDTLSLTLGKGEFKREFKRELKVKDG